MASPNLSAEPVPTSRGAHRDPWTLALAAAGAKLVASRYERMWRSPAAILVRQHQRTHGVLPEIPEGAARAGRSALAGRAGGAHLPEHLAGGLEDVGRTDEDDPQ